MQRDYSKIPPPPLNGGLYTGEPFKPDAPWRAFPVIPCTGYLTHVNLRSANPPIQALFQQGADYRPGNNSSDLDCGIPGVARFNGDSNFGPFSGIRCMPCLKKVDCSCGFDCPCKEKHQGGCPCKSGGCPIKYIPID